LEHEAARLLLLLRGTFGATLFSLAIDDLLVHFRIDLLGVRHLSLALQRRDSTESPAIARG